jgi:trimeric autotransporter adhesin
MFMRRFILLMLIVATTNQSLAQNVGIGINNPGGKLHIKGDANVPQLVIDANSTQTNINPLIFLRKSDGTPLMHIHTDAIQNLFIGYNTGNSNIFIQSVSGDANTFVGSFAGNLNTTGRFNTAVGSTAFLSNTTGSNNTVHGVQALSSNITGFSNVAVGTNALFKNTIGAWLVAVGDSALYNNMSGGPGSFNGFGNTAIGSKGLYTNTTGYYNSAMGFNSLLKNNTGYENTAIGINSLYENTIGYGNTAMGSQSLILNSSGDNNAAVGKGALSSNTTGDGNTAMGTAALQSNSTGTHNTAIGNLSNVVFGNLTNATAIGANARIDCSNCMILGSVNGINGGASNVNVGIGQTNPGFPLNFGSTTGDKISFFGNSGMHYGIGVQDYLLQIHTDLTQSDIAFGYGSSASFTETMRVKGNGRVGIGTNDPQSMLHLGNAGVLRINDGSGTRYAQLFYSNNGNLHLDAFGGGTNYISWYGGTGLHVGNGTAAGYGGVNASAFINSSSQRAKKNITNTHYGLTEILQLQAKEYNYISDKENRNEIGLIAEEVEKIIPEVVYRNLPDKKISGIDYTKLAPVLIEAIKEQQQQIDNLKKQVEQLLKHPHR